MVKVIGISGCTNSGKSTLARELCEVFAKSVTVNQDDFYYPRDVQHMPYIEDLESFNFDTDKAIDFEKLNKKIDELKAAEDKYDFIFVDGSLIYANEQLAKSLDRKYFLLLNKRDSYERRMQRKYKISNSPDYFEKCVWPEYLKYRQLCANKFDDIVYVDANTSIENILKFVGNDIVKNLIKN